MGSDVECMVLEAMRSLAERDNGIARAVRDTDEHVDRLEKVIDENCSRILATQQPTAIDLRFLVAAMKITNDLERMGDCAVSIAKSARMANVEPALPLEGDLSKMAELAIQQSRTALQALISKDSRTALEVRDRDRKIDKLYRRVFSRVTVVMAEQPEAASRALHVLLVARNLERIGDHSKNIAEDVVYFIEGRDIRHPSLENPVAAAGN